MNRLLSLVCWLLLCLFTSAVAASADTIVIIFDDINQFYGVGNNYARYGITFLDNARIVVYELNGGAGSFVPAPGPGISSLGLLDGSAITMNASTGFTSSVSFDYIAGTPGSVTIYSGLNGTGSVLATMNLPVTPTCSTGPTYCQWVPILLDFSGTATSALFGGQHLYLLVDNIKVNAPKALLWFPNLGRYRGANRHRRAFPARAKTRASRET